MFETGRLVIDYVKVEMPEPEGVSGDFNDDGNVDTADYVVWRKVNNTETALPNDDGLGVPISDQHYNLWVSNYGSGEGNGASAGAAPEPASMACLVLGLLVAAASCRYRS
jgi:hypothetical protein